MSNEHDLEQVGKRMPYTAPEGWLDELEARVWQQIGEGEPAEAVTAVPEQRQGHGRRWLYALIGGVAAACIALVMVVKVVPHYREARNMEQIETAFAQLSNADQDYLLEVYEDDVLFDESTNEL